ncbi:hypothetical protein [Dactylosporangium sp. NPDC006015]|uniref:hypothetical protein n=1 Tax=Dactylosporangium sp. NPDC006015 TaxID=3154576 RepID=UPI0033ACE8E1
MRIASVLRTTAVGLALSACVLLLGLSRAHDALPGDTFQFARGTVAIAAAGAETPHGRKLPESRDLRSGAPHWLAVLPPVTDADPVLGPACRGPAAAIVHAGRPAAAPTCRGPPIS